jgi:hypothetical protein
VLRKVRNVVLAVAAILTLFGVASLVTVRSAVVDTAATKLASDSRVRDDIVAAAVPKLDRVNAVLQRSEALERRIDEEQTRALTVVSSDLERVLQMVQQLREDLRRARESR